jgi:hypothetical protein
LKEAVSQSEERITATDLINQRQREAVALHQRYPAAAIEQDKRQQRERDRER